MCMSGLLSLYSAHRNFLGTLLVDHNLVGGCMPPVLVRFRLITNVLRC